MNEQLSQTPASPPQTATTSVCPHPEAAGTRWGDIISEDRQTELQGILDAWDAEVDHGNRKGPFAVSDLFDDADPQVQLTGADIFWLVMHVMREMSGRVPGLHLEQSDLRFLHLEGAFLNQAHFEGAFVFATHLEYAELREARLEGADLSNTHLERADLRRAHLEAANLNEAHLEGANMRAAWLDSKTVLSKAVLDTSSALGDIQWGGVGAVNLTQLDWSAVPTLGDEREAGIRAAVSLHEQAVRAYRQLAAQLRVQGMTEVADHFAYRAQVRQRMLYLRRFRIPQYLGSLFLDLISGYGYRPIRSLITYVFVILAFAAAYFGLGGANGQPLTWNEAIVVSMTAFHGRGFFAAIFQPGDLQAAVAAVEAFIGLLIEIVFIATFTQRFFAR